MHIINIAGANGGVTILNGPRDAHVTVGESAFYNCSYTGTDSPPTWIINNLHFFSNFPIRHYYHYWEQYLEVTNTQLSDNGSTYQCAFARETSGIAILTVYEASKETFPSKLNNMTDKE